MTEQTKAIITVSAILCVSAVIFLIIYRSELGYFPWSDVAKSIRERNAKRDRYRMEFLGYGFTAKEALEKAEARMKKEATEADTL